MYIKVSIKCQRQYSKRTDTLKWGAGVGIDGHWVPWWKEVHTLVLTVMLELLARETMVNDIINHRTASIKKF